MAIINKYIVIVLRSKGTQWSWLCPSHAHAWPTPLPTLNLPASAGRPSSLDPDGLSALETLRCSPTLPLDHESHETLTQTQVMQVQVDDSLQVIDDTPQPAPPDSLPLPAELEQDSVQPVQQCEFEPEELEEGVTRSLKRKSSNASWAPPGPDNLNDVIGTVTANVELMRNYGIITGNGTIQAEARRLGRQ